MLCFAPGPSVEKRKRKKKKKKKRKEKTRLVLTFKMSAAKTGGEPSDPPSVVALYLKLCPLGLLRISVCVGLPITGGVPAN